MSVVDGFLWSPLGDSRRPRVLLVLDGVKSSAKVVAAGSNAEFVESRRLFQRPIERKPTHSASSFKIRYLLIVRVEFDFMSEERCVFWKWGCIQL